MWKGSLRGGRSTSSSLSLPDIVDFQESGAFAGAAGWRRGMVNWGTENGTRRVWSLAVTNNFFEVTRTPALVGRTISEADRGSDVAMLSHGFWRREFGEDMSVVGSSLTLGARSYTVVGVLPEGFTGVQLSPVDVWVPLRSAGGEWMGGPWETSYGHYWVRAIGRLPEGAVEEQVQQAATVAHRAARTAVSSRYDPEAQVLMGCILAPVPGSDANEQRVARLLAAVSLLVLLVACANVANLLLSRGLKRRKEIAVRLALGVSRTRLIAQIITESVTLAFVGAIAGVLLAQWGGGFVRDALLPQVDWGGPGIDPRTLVFAIGASLVAGVLSGLIPGLSGREDGNRRTDQVRRTRGWIQGVQGAHSATHGPGELSVVLLVGAGLFRPGAFSRCSRSTSGWMLGISNS